MAIRKPASIQKLKKMREKSVEDYLADELRALGGICVKLNPNWYIGIPDRSCAALGYVCLVETKRPKGGRFSVPQKMWKKFCTMAGIPWHLINTHDAVDDFIWNIRSGQLRNGHTQQTDRAR